MSDGSSDEAFNHIPIKRRVIRRKRSRIFMYDDSSSEDDLDANGNNKKGLYPRVVLSNICNGNPKNNGGVGVNFKVKGLTRLQKQDGTKAKKRTNDDDDYVANISSDLSDEENTRQSDGSTKSANKNKPTTFNNVLKQNADIIKQRYNDRSTYLHINLDGETSRYNVKMSETIESVLLNIGLRHNVSIHRVKICKRDMRILPSHTAKSLDLNSHQKLECEILDRESERQCCNETINIVIQSDDTKMNIKYRVLPTEPLQNTMELYAQHVEYELNQLIFQYNGETINSGDTPGDLGMIHENVVTVSLKQEE